MKQWSVASGDEWPNKLLPDAGLHDSEVMSIGVTVVGRISDRHPRKSAGLGTFSKTQEWSTRPNSYSN